MSKDVALEEGVVEVTVLAFEEQEYELGVTLGVGGFAEVRMCTDTTTGEIYAVKVFKKSFLTKRQYSSASGGWQTNMDGVYREIAIMKQLDHANVMTLHAVSKSSNNLYMVMDFCPRGAIMETGDLPCEPLPLASCRRWFADAVLGLQYLHFQGVVHHDLKPDNILVNSKGDAVITDFGVSRAHGGTSAKMSVGGHGTPLYNAPEKFSATGGQYDGTAADVWALGATLHAMVFGELPYPAASHDTPEVLAAAITDETEWSCAHACDDLNLVNLLSGMMRKKPSERLTLEEVHNAPWDASAIAEAEATGSGSKANWRLITLGEESGKLAVAQGEMVVKFVTRPVFASVDVARRSLLTILCTTLGCASGAAKKATASVHPLWAATGGAVLGSSIMAPVMSSSKEQVERARAAAAGTAALATGTATGATAAAKAAAVRAAIKAQALADASNNRLSNVVNRKSSSGHVTAERSG